MPTPVSSHPIHVVILAAGRGSRLGSLTADTPKWLLPVGGRTLADVQLDGVELARETLGTDLASVSVVSGHAAATLRAFLPSRSGSAVEVVHNPDFESINNWLSVLLALQAIPEGQRVVVMNGDLLARPSWLAAFVVAAATES